MLSVVVLTPSIYVTKVIINSSLHVARVFGSFFELTS